MAHQAERPARLAPRLDDVSTECQIGAIEQALDRRARAGHLVHHVVDRSTFDMAKHPRHARSGRQPAQHGVDLLQRCLDLGARCAVRLTGEAKTPPGRPVAAGSR